MKYIIFFIFTIAFLFVGYIGTKENIMSKRNPSPKFENGDKRFKDVKIYKTREISIDKK